MKILVTGSSGLVGRNLLNTLEHLDYEIIAPTHQELDLLNRVAVAETIKSIKPDMVIHLAALVGGIQANINNPVTFLVNNMMMGMNVVYEAFLAGVPRLINMGTSCMYPKDKEILNEDDLLTAPLEPTNEGYALAKISVVRLCQYIALKHGLDYRSIVPCNLYGPFDNFDPITSHLIPAVLRKLHEAKLQNKKSVTIWGDGLALREFMYVQDLVDFIIQFMSNLEALPMITNVGLGKDYSIKQYYRMAADVVGYAGEFEFDLTKPVGMKKKLLDSTRAHALGWSPKISPSDGLRLTYQYFIDL